MIVKIQVVYFFCHDDFNIKHVKALLLELDAAGGKMVLEEVRSIIDIVFIQRHRQYQCLRKTDRPFEQYKGLF